MAGGPAKIALVALAGCLLAFLVASGSGSGRDTAVASAPVADSPEPSAPGQLPQAPAAPAPVGAAPPASSTLVAAPPAPLSQPSRPETVAPPELADDAVLPTAQDPQAREVLRQFSRELSEQSARCANLASGPRSSVPVRVIFRRVAAAGDEWQAFAAVSAEPMPFAGPAGASVAAPQSAVCLVSALRARPVFFPRSAAPAGEFTELFFLDLPSVAAPL